MRITTPRKKASLVTRIATWTIIGVIALVCLTGVLGFWFWKSRPSYWRANQRTMAEQETNLPAMADQIENALLSDVSRVDSEGERTTIRVPYAFANAWLRVKLPQWVANQGMAIPPPVSHFMVAQDGGKPVLAFALKTPEVDQVISMRFNVQMTESGEATVRLDSFKAGELSIPAESMMEHLSRKLPAYDLSVLRYIVQGKAFTPVVRHPGHQARNLRLVGFKAEPDGLLLTLKAEPR